MKRLTVYLKTYWTKYWCVDIIMAFLLTIVMTLVTGIIVQMKHDTFFDRLTSGPMRDMAIFAQRNDCEEPYGDYGLIFYSPDDANVSQVLEQKTKYGSYTTGSFRTGVFEETLVFTIGDYGFMKAVPLRLRGGKGFTFTQPEIIVSYSSRKFYHLGHNYTMAIRSRLGNESFIVDVKVVGYTDGMDLPKMHLYNGNFLCLPELPQFSERYDLYGISQNELDQLPRKPDGVLDNRLYTVGAYYGQIPKSADDLNLIAYGAFILFMLIVFIIMTGAYVNGRNQRKLQGTALLVGISKRDLFVANLLRAAAIFVFSLVVTAVAIAWAGQTFYQLTFGGLPVGALVPLALCGLLALIDYLQLRKLEIHAVLKAET